MIIRTNIEFLRDPFILLHDGVYYAYGTDVTSGDWNATVWACYKNTSGRLDGEWTRIQKPLYVDPEFAVKNHWAPEVHEYKGSFYMFATYYSSQTEHKGCAVLKSDSPEGPFEEISNGHVTPPDIDAIDGTLYVDADGQPWMIYVWEWSCTDDGVGKMAAAKLSDDLTCFISEPAVLFRADEPSWAAAPVTDGCFMYETETHELLMLWSNMCADGYCVGVAKSSGGTVTGKWEHFDELLFSKQTTGEYDGGHGMIFKALDGKKYLTVHSPNTQNEETGERVVIISVREENGRLICDI